MLQSSRLNYHVNRLQHSVIFVLIYFLVLVFQLFFSFSFVLVLVFVNEFVIFSFMTIFVFVNENHTASAHQESITCLCAVVIQSPKSCHASVTFTAAFSVACP